MAYIASSGDGSTHSTPRSFGTRARQGLTIVVTLVVILSMTAAAAPVVATGAQDEADTSTQQDASFAPTEATNTTSPAGPNHVADTRVGGVGAEANCSDARTQATHPASPTGVPHSLQAPGPVLDKRGRPICFEASPQSEARDRIDRTRDTVTRDSLADAVQGAAQLADAETEPTQAVEPDGLADPPSSGSPIDELVAAQADATRQAEAATEDIDRQLGPDALRSLLLRPHATPSNADADVGAPTDTPPLAANAAGTAPDGVTVEPQPDPTARADARAIADSIDRQQMIDGALRLAATIDEVLPRLQAQAGTMGSSATTDQAEPCDIRDTPDGVCVSSTADHTYTEDYRVLVDLGGNDTYHNAAGSADSGAIEPGAGNGLYAAVAIDLEGNDTYDTDPAAFSEGSTGARLGQGAGYGGVGMLVDDGDGDDTYRVRGTQADQRAYGQGAGVAGVGVVQDRGGEDTYELTARDDAGVASGQGFAAQGGVAVLSDRGNGHDAYDITVAADPAHHTEGVYPAPVLAAGQAAGVLGAGALFHDGGGDGRMTIDGHSRPIAADHPNHRTYVVSLGAAVGQGYTSPLIGVENSGAVALAGEGDTTWRITSTTQAPWSGQRQAQGMGTASAAALSDAGGNDTYTMKAISEAQREVTVTDDCECQGAEALAQAGSPSDRDGAYLIYHSATGNGMGSGGYLEDEGGDDVYRMRTQGTGTALAVDNRTQTFGSEALNFGAQAEAGGSIHTLDAQKNLLDREGDDAYHANAIGWGNATASAQRDEAPEHADAAVGFVRAYAQGAGDGLVDRAGTDLYQARANSSVVADPSSSLTPSEASMVAQPGTGQLVDTDGAGEDTFTRSPSREACLGEQGGTVWVDCYGGVGANPTNQALSILSPLPTTGGNQR
jgi:hypothetical protein